MQDAVCFIFESLACKLVNLHSIAVMVEYDNVFEQDIENIRCVIALCRFVCYWDGLKIAHGIVGRKAIKTAHSFLVVLNV